MPNFGPWTLTDAESQRLADYQRCAKLLSKKASDIDQLYAADTAAAAGTTRFVPHLYVRLPELIVCAAADLVLSQAPTLKDAGGAPAVQERLNALSKRSRMWALAWRAIKWTCALGDGYLVVADVAGGRDARAPASLPVITFRRATGSLARNVRPEDSLARRAFLFQSAYNGLDLYSEYTAGKIVNKAFKAGAETALPDGYAPEIATKEPAPLAVHLGTLRGDDDDESLGGSDVEAIEELVFEVANRLRQVKKILDRHAEPAMNVPGGTLDENSALDISRKKVFERDAAGMGAEYLVWQSQIEGAFMEIDRMVDLALMMTETPGVLFGRGGEGQAESGRALKFKLLSGLGKARRSGAMLKEALEEVARLALRREDILVGKTPGEYEIECVLPDTFIADEIETAQYVQALRAAGSMSVRRAVEVGQGLSGDELEAEVATIGEEAPAAPAGGLGFGA
jgi:hypothetical protein